MLHFGGSDRVKTELLVQINGVASSEQDNARVIVLAATNLPWELDEAMRRRLTKRVYVPLPDADARRALFQLNLRLAEVASDVDFGGLVTQTQVTFQMTCENRMVIWLANLIVAVVAGV